MKKIIVAIFAHPDDEAFGPAGTLLKLKSEGYDIHLILLTDGEAGTNPDDVADLGAVRRAEWQAAAEVLGASSAHALHYPDGALERVATSELDDIVGGLIARIEASYGEPTELSFMTFEPNGLTGHRDHVAASELTTRMAARFKTHQIWYFCLDKTQAPLEGTAYYEPRARDDDFITHRIDVRDFLAQKYAAMDCHASQAADATAMKKLGDDLLATECFHVIS